MNKVAPNSPRDTAAQNPAATTKARAVIGKSTSSHTCLGDAPSIVAASRSRGSMLRNAGTTARTTNGIAITAWATGTRRNDVANVCGACWYATRKPKPIVTADVPSGSIRSVSTVRVARLGRCAIATEARPPTTSAITVAIAANFTEFHTAAHGETKSVEVDALDPRARYAASDHCPPALSERTTSRTSGPPRNS